MILRGNSAIKIMFSHNRYRVAQRIIDAARSQAEKRLAHEGLVVTFKDMSLLPTEKTNCSPFEQLRDVSRGNV